MILDKLMEFDPAGTAITATAVSTNVFDLHGASLIPGSTLKPGRDMGPGFPLRCLVTVQTTLVAAGAATLQVQLQGAPDDGTGAQGAYVTYIETPAIAKATLVAGTRIFDIDVPRPLPTPVTPALLPRFLRLNYIVATGPFTGGTVQSEIVLGRDDIVNYQPGIVVAN